MPARSTFVGGLFLVSLKSRKIIQVRNLPILHRKAVMGETIGNGQKRWTNGKVVAGYLGKCLRGDSYIGRFALYQQMRFAVGSKHHDVRTLGEFVVVKPRFYGKKSFWVLVVVYKQVHKMLPYPLFGGKQDVFSTNEVVNMRFPV